MYHTLIVQNTETWTWRHSRSHNDCVPALFSIEMQNLFEDMQKLLRISVYGLVKHTRDRNTHIEFQVTRLKFRVIMTHKQTIISNEIAMNVFNANLFYFIFQQYMKSGSYKSNFGSKGQRSIFRRFSGCTYFLTRYLNTSWSVLLSTLDAN